jgi:hypothetical protein
LAQLDICNVLRVISDDKSLALFKTVALTTDSPTVAISRLKLTRKQYYSRMSAMTTAGLITRRNGRYFLTSVGKVVHEAQMLISRAQQDYWKLRAVDAIEYCNDALTFEQRDGFINNMIADNDLRKVLLHGNKSKS